MDKQNIPKNNIIGILNDAAFQEAYFVPKIPIEYKDSIFEIDDMSHIANYDITVKVKYILDLGYFKVKKTFFKYKFTEVLDDVVFVLKKYFPNVKANQIKTKQPRKDSVNTLRNHILKEFNYNYYSPKYDNLIINDLKESSFKYNLSPKQIFEKIVTKILPKHKLTLPEYRRIQTIISKIITNFENEIYPKVLEMLSDKDIGNIEEIFELYSKKESILSYLKTSGRGFSHNGVKEEIKRRKFMQEIYDRSKIVLKELNISLATIKYYAKLVDIYEMKRTQR